MRQKSIITINPKWRIQGWYIPILTFAMGLMMLRPLLMARLFDTEGFATYSAGLLVSTTFCMLGCLGIQSMLQRKMPMDLIAGKELASLILLFQGVIVAVVSAVLFSGLGLSGFLIAGLSSEGFAVSILHGMSQQLFVLATIESRSRGEPLRFSCQYLIRAGLVVTGAGIVAFYTLSPQLTLLIEAVLSIIVVWHILLRVVLRKPISLVHLFVSAVQNMLRIRWREAFSLMAVMIIGFTLINVDRWIAATWLSSEEFAWYAFAWILVATAQSAQSIINSSVYPALSRRYAVGGRSSSFTLAAKASILLLGIGIIFALPAFYVLKILTLNWFSEYSESLRLIPIFLAVALVRLTDFWSSHLLIIGKERYLLLINVTAAVTVMFVWFGLIFFKVPGDFDVLHLSYLALSLTMANYLSVLIVAYKFKSE